MSGLPPDFYNRCREVLKRCSEFQSNESLRAVFIPEGLAAYRDKLPEASNIDLRVDQCLAYLYDKRWQGQSVLLLFLETLRDKYPEGDDLHRELVTLVQDFSLIMQKTQTLIVIPSSPVSQHFSLHNFVRPLIIGVCLFLLIGGSIFLLYTGYYLPNQQHTSATATALAVRTRLNSTATARIVNATAVLATATVLYATGKNPYPPYGGTLVLNALLNENTQDSAWSYGSQADVGGCAFTGGAYHAQVLQSNEFYYCPYSSTFSDFAYQVQMTIIKGDEGGIAFRISGSGSLYHFYIDTRGDYELDINKNHNPIGTLTSGFSSAIKRGYNQPNLIAVVAQGNSFDLYVNLQPLAHVSDTTFSSGQIGVIAIDVTQPTEVVFSNAKVWVL